ncbi:Flap endonuclease 1, partial [Hondaea fermentalgiana]
IDALVWLHMYVSVQHEEVSKGNFTSVVQGFIGRLKKLKKWGARPIVVFNGVSNEMKANTNSARSNKRDKMVKGLMEDLQACLNAGEEPSTALMEKISQANAGVTRDLVYAVIRQLRVEGYPYVVAPYEADHTLAALLHEGFIQYIISVDSDMLVHHGGNVVVIPPGFWQDGLGILYDPAANTAPADESTALCDRPRDLGLIIDRVVGQHACEPREAAAAVCLAYALLVDSDYHNLKGVGAETALFVMELLLHRRVTLESWKDPDQLADILCNNYAKQLRKEDVVSDMKRAKGGLLGGIALHLAKREINHLDEKVAIDTGCIGRFGKTSFDREQVDLISLGLLCMRDGCGCQREKPKHHDVGPGYSVIQPQDTVHPVQLTEDLIIGAKMCEEHVDSASRAQLARWLRTRGQFA